MWSDFFFRMGSTHAVCQDYAVAGQSGNVTYAMLADGCSGKHIPGEPGSPYTDFGARFLVRCAQRYLGEMVAGRFPETAIVHDAQAITHQAHLPSVSLDATLLAVVAQPGGSALTFQTGDGVIAIRHRDGTRTYQSVEFGNNMPYYLSYLLHPTRRQSFFKPPPEAGVSPEEAGKAFMTTGAKQPGGPWERTQWTFHINPTEPLTFTGRHEPHPTELVMLLSDGASSFQLKDGTPVPLEDVLDQLFEIKGFAGQFLTRRCTRFLQTFCAERGWQHSDDFSVAGIYLGASP